jgi:hypothetical protein
MGLDEILSPVREYDLRTGLESQLCGICPDHYGGKLRRRGPSGAGSPWAAPSLLGGFEGPRRPAGAAAALFANTKTEAPNRNSTQTLRSNQPPHDQHLHSGITSIP